MTWEAKWDIVVGFCGAKNDNVCQSNFKIVVGDGKAGYEKTLDVFSSNKVGNFSWFIIANPLHEKIPQLMLVVSRTCTLTQCG